ncbi:MAG: fimbria/pilus outer membrane usher protein [Pseudomonadota bacterium]
MTIKKSRHCPSLIALSVTLAAALASAGAVAASPPTPDNAAPPAAGLSGASQPLELYLAVTLNGVPIEELKPFVMQRGVLYASAATLRDLGLKWPGSDTAAAQVALASLAGLQVSYDEPRQRIALTAPVALLDRPLLKIDAGLGDRPRVDPSARVPGVLLNYDLYAQQSAGRGALNGVTEARLFGVGPGIFSNTMATRVGVGAGNTQGRNVRLDSSWQRDFPDQLMTLTLGDTITGALPWSRALRIGGVRLASNFGLQPYRVTAPLAAFQGSAVLPSTVDLFINGMKQSTQQVQPGQFQLNAAPSLNGSGQAQMVITDINGQSRFVSFDIYGSPQLLAAGLSDWSLDAGVIRRDYALKSFSYGSDPVLSGSARYGWSDAVTLEGHAEATRDLQLAGAGAAWLLGRQMGIVSASLAGSRSVDAAAAAGNTASTGVQASLGYQWVARYFNFSLNALRADAGYRDIASLNGAPVTRRSDSAYMGFDTRFGQFGFALLRQQYTGSELVRFASLNWSRQLDNNSSLTVNFNRSFGDRTGPQLYVGWSMLLDRDTSVAVSGRKTRDSGSATLDAARSAPSDEDGWGWRVQANIGDGSSSSSSGSGQGQLSRTSEYGQFAAGISHFRGVQGSPSSTSAFGNASGSVVMMKGKVQATRRVDDAFAVVSTNGMAGIPVRLENRLVGETDDDGLLFVSRLNAYQHNRISIDTLKLPPDMHINRTSRDAVPAGRSGVLAEFEMRRILAVQLSLRDAAGQWLPLGSVVTVAAPGNASTNSSSGAAASQATTVVGYDGLVYLEDPPPGASLQVRTVDGMSCRANLLVPDQSSGLVDLGTLLCQQANISKPASP